MKYEMMYGSKKKVEQATYDEEDMGVEDCDDEDYGSDQT
jgi:hypothetical protein